MFFGKFFEDEAKGPLYFFVFSLSCLLFVLIKISHYPIEKKIKASIAVDQDKIEFLDQKRNPKLLQTQFFETLDFPKAKFLTHKSGKILGFAKNYFIEFEAKAVVSNAGSYVFTVESDDGFRLSIDGKKIAEFTHTRRTEKNSINTILTKGKHSIQLSYFQGSGNATVTLHYLSPQESKTVPLGEDSKAISFIPWP